MEDTPTHKHLKLIFEETMGYQQNKEPKNHGKVDFEYGQTLKSTLKNVWQRQNKNKYLAAPKQVGSIKVLIFNLNFLIAKSAPNSN